MRLQSDGHALDELRVEHPENTVLRLLKHRRAAVNRERLLLAQGQQTREVIDITIAEKDSCYGSLARRAPRVETAIVVNLLPQVRRGVQDNPSKAVGTYGDGRLSTGSGGRVADAGTLTGGRIGIPLREGTACCGA